MVQAKEIHPDIERVLLDEDQIYAIITKMGAEISRDYAGKHPILIAVLKGACLVMADLMRAIDVDCSIDFMATSSYGNGTKSSGVVKILKDLNENIEGRDVIIVEDLLDSGITLEFLKETLQARNPKSIAIATFLIKDLPDRQCVVTPDYIGSEIENEFIVGYGFDYAEKYRNLPYVGILKQSVYEGKANE